MVNERAKKLVRIALLALLLCLLGTATLGSVEGNAAPQALSGEATIQTQVGQQACYTIDTSRPEWLGNWTAIYLPVITKSFAP
jgi:hypothetical protein